MPKTFSQTKQNNLYHVKSLNRIQVSRCSRISVKTLGLNFAFLKYRKYSDGFNGIFADTFYHFVDKYLTFIKGTY